MKRKNAATEARPTAPHLPKALRAGGYSVLAAALVALLAAAAVGLVRALPERLTRLDVTQDGLYTFSEQTAQTVGALTQDVSVYLIAQPGNEDAMLTALIARYTGASAHITFQTVDPVASPQFLSQYSSDYLTENSLVVACGERSRYIPYDDLYQADTETQYDDGSYATVFCGERELTSALDYVTSASLPTAYVLSGHGEADMSVTLSTLVKRENVALASLNLLSRGGVPDDCACLIVNAPARDLSADEKTQILDYLGGGGRLLLVLDATADTPNVAALLSHYGVTIAPGVVVEGSESYYMQGYPLYILADIFRHAVTEPLLSGGYAALMPAAAGMTLGEAPRAGVTAEALLATSSKAYAKAAGASMTTYDREDGDIAGPFTLAAAITEALPGGGTARVAAFGSAMMFTDEVSHSVSGANQELFVNAVDWLTGRNERIGLRGKRLTDGVLTVPTGVAAAWSAGMILLLPLGLIATGVAITARRRRR